MKTVDEFEAERNQERDAEQNVWKRRRFAHRREIFEQMQDAVRRARADGEQKEQ
ncbi:hypothetical protein [Caballeronia sp. ATUFL_F2_KS9A]|uniref:hypothetical protein n=1 Tax=Caballeronia sp. ATUFL_F2_KS9A TaxID=2921777 RepID=UPI0020297A27|nr:hypothetical protein [Caballeronia sp. ATUFL_F2_KS9A]